MIFYKNNVFYYLNDDNFRGHSRDDCNLIGGTPDQSLEDCVTGDHLNLGCSSFLEVNCVYNGLELAYQPPDGEVDRIGRCHEFCQDFKPFGCAYWLYDTPTGVCTLLDSQERKCFGLSGTPKPDLDLCMPTTTTTSSIVETTTDNI